MSNLIQEIQESLNETVPLKVDIKPVLQTTPTPDPVLSGVIQPSTSVPQQQQTVAQPTPSAPLQPVTSTGQAPPEIPQVDALSYGRTITEMSAQSAAEIQKTLATPPKNEVQKATTGNNNLPVQIDPKLSSQNNPFTPKTAQDRLLFEPPVLANGLGNPFSDPNAIAAIRAGISKDEYLAYKKDQDSDTSSTPLIDLGFQKFIQNNSQARKILNSFEGMSAEQIRAVMSRSAGYNTFRRNFNQAFLPLSGGENRNELETLFAALSFPANLFKGIGLDIGRGVSSVISGGFNAEQIKKDYEAMRPTRGGTFTGAAILGEQFNSMAVIDEKDRPFNPLAAVRNDSNIFQVGLGFGLDVLSDPLNSNALSGRLFRPFRRVEQVVADVTPPPTVVTSKEIIPYVKKSDTILVTRPSDLTVVRQAEVKIPPQTVIPQSREIIPPVTKETPTPQSREIVPYNPPEVIIQRESANVTTLARYEPVQVEFPTPRVPFKIIPDSKAIVPVDEVRMYDNVIATFNDSPDLPVVQRFMRDVVEQKPFEQIPDARSLVVRQNPILREVAEFARTGETTPNIAVLKGATAEDVSAIVADRLALVRETPITVPRIVAQPLEVPELEFDIPRSISRNAPEPVAFREVSLGTPSRTGLVDLESIVDNTKSTQNPAKIDALAARIVEAGDNIEPVVLRQVSPVKFEVLGDNTNFLAVKRAQEMNPNLEVRSVIVKEGSAVEEVYIRQQKAAADVRKFATDAEFKSNSIDAPPVTDKLRTENSRTFSVEVDNIVTQRGGAYSKEAVETLARNFLETGENIRPVVLRRTGADSFEVIRGNLEYLAAKRAQELDPNFTALRSYIVDAVNEGALLAQLDILDDVIPVPVSKPVVLTEPTFTSLSDLQDAARSGDTFGEVSSWSVKRDYNTPFKEILNAVDDLGIDVLNIPALQKLAKAKVGKLSDKSIVELSKALNKVKGDLDVPKSVFDGLWRKATEEQKEIILSTISTDKLNKLGLERAETKVTPPTTPPLLQYDKAALDPSLTIDYMIVNDSVLPVGTLRAAMLREQGLSGREANALRVYPLTEEIALTAKVSENSLSDFLKEISVASPAERNWSSKMLQQVWDVVTPEQKVRILSEIDTPTLNQLGVERIARSNVIDDFLPPEGVFDSPC